uniref:Uncharacterized protein n=1 Tax=Anopheles atroparvus TaxID=41427 RepID=A0AAG5D4N1_ANOAO
RVAYLFRYCTNKVFSYFCSYIYSCSEFILRSGNKVGVGLNPSKEVGHTSVDRRHANRATGGGSERHDTDLEALSTILDSQRTTGVTVARRATVSSIQTHVLGLDKGGVPTGNAVSVGHDRVGGEPNYCRGGRAGIRGAAESRDGSREASELTAVRTGRKTGRLDASGVGNGRVQADHGDIVADVGRGVLRVTDDSTGREGDALLRRLIHIAVVGSHDGRTSVSQSRSAGHDAMGSGQDEVVGQNGSSAQTGSGAEVAEQRNLVRELAGGSLKAVGDAGRRLQVTVDLQLSRQASPVVIELLDRAHLGPIDFDPFGADDGEQTNKEHEGFHLDTQ